MLTPYQYVGTITSLWSILERSIDQECWRLAGINDEIGSCFTAQTSQARAKMITLEALVTHRGGSEEIKKKIRNFRDKIVSPVGEERNRAIHDPIYSKLESNEIVIDTLTLSIKGKVKSIRSPSINELRDTLLNVKNAYEVFESFIPDLEKLYPTSA